MPDTGAFDGFITAALANLSGEPPEVQDACATAMGKAKLLFTGSPVGTILRNTVTGASAQRAINGGGIPLWQCSDNTGARWDDHDVVLTPEVDWQCIYDPDAV